MGYSGYELREQPYFTVVNAAFLKDMMLDQASVLNKYGFAGGFFPLFCFCFRRIKILWKTNYTAFIKRVAFSVEKEFLTVLKAFEKYYFPD